MITYEATPDFYNDYIYHYGIKGQQWGVQNGPPYPLDPKSYSRKEQKANFKKLKKARSNDKEFKKATREVVDDSGVLNSEEMKAHLKNVKALKDNWLQLEREAGPNGDFFSGNKYYEAMHKEAYDQTYKWFEKNEPEHLKEAIKINGGSKKNLQFVDHDFRKFNDGFTDQVWDKYESMWAKSPEGKAYEKADKAWDEYYSELSNTGKEISDYLLGKYGGRDRGYFDSRSLGDATRISVNDILSETIKTMGDKKIKK